MEIRTNGDVLKAFLGVSSSTPAQAQRIRSGESAAAQAAFAGDQATLSHAGTEVSQSADQAGVRADKVASIQQALAAGTYNVPSSAVAAKVVAAMLAGGVVTGK